MLQERQYVVRISALLDRSTAGAAGDLVQQYERAGRAAGRRLSEEERNARRAQAAHERAVRHVEGIKDRHFRDEQRRQDATERKAEAAAAKTAKAQERAAEQAARAQEKAAERAATAKQRQEERSQRYVEQIRERHFRNEQRRQEQEESDRVRGRREKIKQFAGDAYQTAAAIGRKAVGVASDLAAGYGVDFSMTRGVSKAVELEQMAVAIVNASNRGEGGIRGVEQRNRDVGDLQTTARQIGNQYAFDPTQVLRGLAQYQALTGDLDTAKAGLGDLAKLAKAFNVDLDKMVAAAGQVGSAIGDVGEGKEFATAEAKAKAVYDVLKALTSQGQEGAIEISDLATQMAKVKAAGGAFEGSTADNIKKMGALAQLSLQLGGSASATQAATSVMGFVSTLKTPARRKEFKALGIDIDSATQKGAFADPFDIIRQSLAKTGGDPEAMKKLFSNVVGERAVTALTNTYNKAGGGDKGMAAINEMLGRFSGTVADTTINEGLARVLNTKGSKAQITQNQLDQRWAELSTRVLPAMEKLAPVAIKIAEGFAKVVEWAAENPGQAIVLAIVASIAKAGIGLAVSAALKSLLERSAAGGAGGAGGGMGAAGGVAAVAAIAAAGYAGYQVLKSGFNEAGKAQTGAVETDIAVQNALTSARSAKKGAMTPEEALKELESASAAQQKRIANVQQDKGYLGAINPFSDTTFAEAGQVQQDKGRVEELKADLAAMTAAINEMKSQIAANAGKTQRVEVTNMPANGPAGNGRQGIGDQGT